MKHHKGFCSTHFYYLTRLQKEKTQNLIRDIEDSDYEPSETSDSHVPLDEEPPSIEPFVHATIHYHKPPVVDDGNLPPQTVSVKNPFVGVSDESSDQNFIRPTFLVPSVHSSVESTSPGQSVVQPLVQPVVQPMSQPVVPPSIEHAPPENEYGDYEDYEDFDVDQMEIDQSAPFDYENQIKEVDMMIEKLNEEATRELEK